MDEGCVNVRCCDLEAAPREVRVIRNVTFDCCRGEWMVVTGQKRAPGSRHSCARSTVSCPPSAGRGVGPRVLDARPAPARGAARVALNRDCAAGAGAVRLQVGTGERGDGPPGGRDGARGGGEAGPGLPGPVRSRGQGPGTPRQSLRRRTAASGTGPSDCPATGPADPGRADRTPRRRLGQDRARRDPGSGAAGCDRGDVQPSRDGGCRPGDVPNRSVRGARRERRLR